MTRSSVAAAHLANARSCLTIARALRSDPYFWTIIDRAAEYRARAIRAARVDAIRASVPSLKHPGICAQFDLFDLPEVRS